MRTKRRGPAGAGAGDAASPRVRAAGHGGASRDQANETIQGTNEAEGGNVGCRSQKAQTARHCWKLQGSLRDPEVVDTHMHVHGMCVNTGMCVSR